MATVEQLIFDILARDNASSAFIKTGRSAKDAAGNVQSLNDRLIEVSKQSAEARVGIKGDKQANATLDSLQLKLIKLGAQAANPNITVEGAIKAETQIAAVQRQLDNLGNDNALVKLAGAGALTPSLGGALWALSPAAVPLLAGATAGVGALGISFGAAAIAAGGFGLVAKSVLTSAGQDATKLAALNLKLNSATTKSAKDAARAQIAALEQGWTPAYRQVMANLNTLQIQWKTTAIDIAAPTVATWLKTVTDALKFLKPFLQPVADVFQAWGQTLNRDFSNPQTAGQIQKMAAAFGKFSASQLKDIGTFIGDIATGIFNLGKDLAGTGANLGAAGGWLANMGAGFLTWSKSAQARKDVQGFLRYLHAEGPVVGSILRDLAKYLPAIFQGIVVGGTFELAALTSLLGVIAKLPPNWGKPLIEVAGAMLLLSKTGVLKIGIQIVGAAARWLQGGTLALAGDTAAAEMRAAFATGGAGAAAEIRAAMTGGGSVAAGEEAAGGAAFGAKAGAGLVALAGPIGLGIAAGFLANAGLNKVLPKNVNNLRQPFTVTGVFDNLTHGGAQAIGKDLTQGIELPAKAAMTAWNALVSAVKDGSHQLASSFDGIRHTVASVFHDIANDFDQFRHFQGQTGAFEKDIAWIWDKIHGNTVQTWDFIRHYLAGVLDDMRHSIATDFDDMRNIVATVFDAVRHGISAAWDSIWKNSQSQTSHGVSGVVGFFRQMPGRILGALSGLGTDLWNFGHMIWDKFWNGMKSIVPSILSWVGHFVASIWDKVKKFFGLGSPSKLFYDAGMFLMIGLEKGIKDHGRKAVAAAQGVSHQVTNAGAGVQRWAGLVRKALSMEGLSPSLLGNVLYQMQTESGGNPNAINLSDSNAAAGDPSRGLMQVIMSTFDAYHWPGTSMNIYDPLANIAAALNYARHVYGPGLERGGMGIGSGHGYDTGGWLPVGTSIAVNKTGRPERVLGPNEGLAPVAVLQVKPSASSLERELIGVVLKHVRVAGGGDVQVALGG